MSRIRKRTPTVIVKDGQKALGCPFCRPSHELTLDGKPAVCGTKIEIMAVQDVMQEKDIVCSVCGGAGGTFIKHGGGYRHPGKCSPNRSAIMEMPKISLAANLLWKLPVKVQKSIYSRFKVRSIRVENEKKEVLGYAIETTR